MSLTATARNAAGTLRQEILVDGRHHLLTDQPQHLGGEGAGPSPHELFPAALAGCIAVTLARYGRTKGWELGEIRVDIEYDQHAEPRRVEVGIRFDADLTEAQISRLEKVAAACPLRRSLAIGFEFEESFAGGAAVDPSLRCG
jgi:putative redox protein